MEGGVQEIVDSDSYPHNMTHIVQRPCSHDDTFEQVDIIPSKLPPAGIALDTDVLVTSRTDPLTREQFEAMLDADGRLVNEHLLRKAVFLGGVAPEIRRDVWSFLFGLYPCNSTARERNAILVDNIVCYHERKSRWKTMLVLNSPPNSTPLQQGLCARYQLPEEEKPPVSPELLTTAGTDKPAENIFMSAPSSRSERICFKELGHPELEALYNSPEMLQRVDFMRLQAQVQVNREKINIDNLRSSIRVIDKDVPRTDRDIQFFSGSGNPHLSELRDILITCACYNDRLGYAQGMNDILSRFLYVMGSELFPSSESQEDFSSTIVVETYWCFKTYMEKIGNDFMEDGMTNKIDLVRMLLAEMDQELLKHLNDMDLGNLFFCHRWLLLGFKREFNYNDSLRCFEILSSHHLELSSLEAATAVMREEMKEFENTEGDVRTASLASNKEYTFEVFMCATVLIECRDEFFKCTDNGQVYMFLNSMKFDLDMLLTKSERMFFVYCKKTVGESFQMVNSTSPLISKSGFFSLFR